jgi:hypothetical protein
MRVYLLTSFPSLSAQSPVPMTFEEFFHRCAAHLPETELSALDAACSIPPEGDSPFAKEWSEAWTAFDTVNRRERLQRLPRAAGDALPAAPSTHDRLRGEVQAAWQASNPLERETDLLMAQWNWIEDRRRAAPYSLVDLIGYGLQLKLLERRDGWEETHGVNQFEEHTASFLDPLIEQLRTRDLSA